MGQPVNLPAFSAGELSPALFGRTDLNKFHLGAARLQNFIVDFRGGAVSRPGTKFLGDVSDSSQPSRLVPFVFNTAQSYVLVFSHFKMKVVRSGGFVQASGTDYEVATPYPGDALALLKFTQSADVMTLTHPSYATYLLTRLAHDNWAFAVANFVPQIAIPATVVATPSLTGDATNYVYVVTAVASNGVTESLPSAAATSTNSKTMSQTPGAYTTITWGPTVGAQFYNIYRQPEVATGTPAAGQIFGFVGSSTSGSFVDSNIAPDFTRAPPQSFNPFESSNYPGCVTYFQQRQVFAGSATQPQTLWLSKTGDYLNFGYSIPSRADDSIIAPLASRQVNAIKHLIAMQSLVALTDTGAWRIDSGTQGGPITPTSIEANPQAYNGANDVRPAIVNMSILHATAKGTAVRDLTFQFLQNTYTGTDITILANHLFAGRRILAMDYAEEPFKVLWVVLDDGLLLSCTYLKEQDVYAWAHHDTLGRFKDVCVITEDTEDAVYLTVERGAGTFYLQYVERMASREMGARPEKNVPADLSRAWFVDSGLATALTYPAATLYPQATTAGLSIASAVIVNAGSGYTSFPTVTITDPTGTGADISVTALFGALGVATVNNPGSNYTNPTITVSGGGGTGGVIAANMTRDVTFIADGNVFVVGDVGKTLRANHGWGLVRQYVTPTTVVVNIQQELLDTWPADAGDWSCTANVSSVSGLGHLNGATVSILADGNVMPEQQVVGGAVSLEQPASAVFVGLPYRPRLQSLYLDIPGEATIQGKRKKISAVSVRVQDTRGLRVGHSFDEAEMVEVKDRDYQPMGEAILPFTGDQRVVVDPLWEVAGQICVEQPHPLPATILSLIPEVTIGDTRG